MVANDIGNKVEKGVTKTREVASQVPSRSLSSAQHLGNFALAGAGFGAGMMMNAKSHFQNVGSFFTNKESEHQPDEVLPTETLETPVSPDAPEPNIPKTKPTLEGIKPVEEKHQLLQWNPQSQRSQHQVQTRNSKLLKKNGFLHLNNSALIVLSTN